MQDKVSQVSAVAGSALSANLFASSALLKDPTIYLIATLGAIISIISVIYTVVHEDDKIPFKILFTEVSLGLIAGAIVTPLTFIALNNFGNVGLHYINKNLTVNDIAIWFFFSLMISWSAVSIFWGIKNILNGIKEFIVNKLGGVK